MEPDREDRSAAHAGLRDAWRRRSLASGWLAADDWPSEAVDAVLAAACGTGSLAVKETGLLVVKDTGLALVEDSRLTLACQSSRASARSQAVSRPHARSAQPPGRAG